MTPLLPTGEPIAVVAPSGICNEERFQQGMGIARHHGFDVRALPVKPWRYMAGDDEWRLHKLIEALTAPNWAGVWIARGGYGITRLLAKIPWEELPQRPIIGFSDLTALFGPLHHRKKGPVIHGPVIHSLPATNQHSCDHLFDLLAGRDTAPLRGVTWKAGEASGWLAGGNLCMLAATCGTAWQLDARGAILVLEEVGEAPYRIDRMLQQLLSSRVFDGVTGVAAGQFLTTIPQDGGWNLKDLLLDHLEGLDIPIVGDLPIGHGPQNCAFVWGTKATLHNGALHLAASGETHS
ncbi:MAG: LD-carboxypeptidase [Proteobacteria bacterium]|jgi:muramoyltetrapeptide carboxypeptidase|nr:LD-carboxypeptidase [Pseudomonadota bacterium]